MEQILYFSKPIVLQKRDYHSLYDAWMLCYVMLCLRSDFLSCVNLKVQVMTLATSQNPAWP